MPRTWHRRDGDETLNDSRDLRGAIGAEGGCSAARALQNRRASNRIVSEENFRAIRSRFGAERTSIADLSAGDRECFRGEEPGAADFSTKRRREMRQRLG
jgi:hypothetical protein